MGIEKWIYMFNKEKQLQHRLRRQLEKDGLEKAAMHIAQTICLEVPAPYIMPQFLFKRRSHEIQSYNANGLSFQDHFYKKFKRVNYYQSCAHAIMEAQAVISYFTNTIKDKNYAESLRIRTIGIVIKCWQLDFTSDQNVKQVSQK